MKENDKTDKISGESFQKILSYNELVFVDFYATWCGPCQMMLPVIDQLTSDFKNENVSILKLDIDQIPDVTAKYNVLSVPTFIIFKKGKELSRMQGVIPKEELYSVIKKALN